MILGSAKYAHPHSVVTSFSTLTSDANDSRYFQLYRGRTAIINTVNFVFWNFLRSYCKNFYFISIVAVTDVLINP